MLVLKGYVDAGLFLNKVSVGEGSMCVYHH